MEEMLLFIKELNCQRISELNEEGLLNNNIRLGADINDRDLHFELRNEEKEVLAKTIPEGDLEKYIVGYQMIKCDGHGKKKERRKCNSCQNFQPIRVSAKGNCTARGDIIQRSRTICAFDYIPNKTE